MLHSLPGPLSPPASPAHCASLITHCICPPCPPPLQNLEFLEGYGSFLAETGAQAEAATVLRRAVQLQPEEGFEKYM